MDVAAQHRAKRPGWITAERQTGGRGRGGKPWHAPPGNLQATWTAPADRPLVELPLYSFVAALALRDALGVWIAPTALAFKWPNDVLADGRKIAGILLQSAAGRLSIGIGVNITNAPPRHVLPEHAVPAIAMAELARPDVQEPLRADAVLAHLAIDFERWRADWGAYGFGPIRRAWLEAAANLGAPIRVVLPKETITGIFRNVDETGQLVLETSDGPRRIAAGEVYFDEG